MSRSIGKTYDLVKIFDLYLHKNYFHTSNDNHQKYQGQAQAIIRDLTS